MEHPGFFRRAGPFRLSDVAKACAAVIQDGADPEAQLRDVRPLSLAQAGDISFFDNPKYLDELSRTRASACIVSKKSAERAPAGVLLLLSEQPYHAFARALALFYPDALRPVAAGAAEPGSQGGVHPSARLEDGVIVEPGAVVGQEAHIGRGTRIAAGAVVGYRVHIGRDSDIGPNVSLTNALVGDRVILHAGVSVGQDGFGFAMGPDGHLKVPQIGRVIIQDAVEIGANTTVDRGALNDTVIGEGTKIDNLVQIGHNVVIGRHCVIVAQTGISGSTELEDFVVLGGQVGVVGHVKIGTGAQIAGSSNVRSDVPPGAKWGGTPAKPARTWFRELTALKRLAEQASPGQKRGRDGEPEESASGSDS